MVPEEGLEPTGPLFPLEGVLFIAVPNYSIQLHISMLL